MRAVGKLSDLGDSDFSVIGGILLRNSGWPQVREMTGVGPGDSNCLPTLRFCNPKGGNSATGKC